ncbi:MAG: AAA family ATPase [Lachnospiraceae bacterium]|nr:AAA family ATPase [Lachnospiraceae bacterium]
MDNYLENLNEEQLKAVTTTEGYVRVIAGAGSGKTRALTSRYVYLVNELGISTSNILCVTFTNKAASEMKNRIRTMIGDQDTGYISTFHGFCVQVLREDIHTMNYPENFMILDSDDMDTILKKVYEESHIKSSKYVFSMAKDMIGARKDTLSHIPYMLDTDNTRLKQMYRNASSIEDKIYYGFLYEQKKAFALDYDDLITFVIHIFRTHEEKKIKWQQRMEYVMVDEFQDIDHNQYEIAETVSGIHKNLFIVGDPDQTIYSWRGAKVEFILDFLKIHQNGTDIVMDKNYRSASDIIFASNSLIDKNRKRVKKNLVPQREKIRPVVYHHAKTTGEEASWIVEQIQKIVGTGKKYEDITILYRAHYVSRSVEEALLRNKIPYTIYSGIEFYKRREIKDILSYLRMIIYKDDMSFLRVINVPARNIGKKRIELITEYANENECTLYESLLANMDNELIKNSDADEFVELIEKYSEDYNKYKLLDLINEVLVDSGYEKLLRLGGEEERLANMAEFKQSIYEYEKTAGEDTNLTEYLQSVSLFTNMDAEEKKQSVKLMTVHNAKGLEFPYVFVCGMNEGIFPSQHTDTLDKLEEERRLAYVSFTRAQNVLFISDAEGVNFDGLFRYPSRFIFNTDTSFVEYTVELEDEMVNSANSYISANENKIYALVDNQFCPGDRILHKVFGEGTIMEIDAQTTSFVIKFDKLDTVRNINMRVKLEKI